MSVVAILEGMRNENAMSGWGSMAIELNEERVAPWNLACRCLPSSLDPSSSEIEVEEEVDGEEEGSQTGMREVTTATGWAVLRRRLRRSVRTRAWDCVTVLWWWWVLILWFG